MQCTINKFNTYIVQRQSTLNVKERKERIYFNADNKLKY